MIDTRARESLLRSDTTLIAYGDFLRLLRGQGYERASSWLEAHGADVGRRSAIDLRALFG